MSHPQTRAEATVRHHRVEPSFSAYNRLVALAFGLAGAGLLLYASRAGLGFAHDEASIRAALGGVRGHVQV